SIKLTVTVKVKFLNSLSGHQVVLCPHVTITSTSCRGFLHKKGSKLNGWSRRWFVFDRSKHTLTYYSDKSEKKTRGGAYFQAIEEVYLDHLNSIKSPNPQLTFVVKTHERFYYLMAPSPESMRIWVDVIFTGAEGYREFDHGT
ncbi:pleckstrin homology-like domain family B member 1, partial [Cylas formicarius]|uniref:pleckstrin homology-like domain family B member 1 n=1 Tax=Cylas formicarius TaxID=197179 RepID=UPI0029587DDB